MISCWSISPFILVIKPTSHDHHSIMLSRRTLNFQLDHFVWLALGWAWLPGFTGDVAPWGSSVQQGFVIFILRQILWPSAEHTTFLLSMLWCSPFLACLPQNSDFPQALSFVSWLATLLPSSQGTSGPLHRAILPSHYQAQQPTHLPPVPWPFPLPPIRSALSPCLMIQLLFSQETYTKNLPLFFPVPSQLYFPKWCLNNHEFFLLKINPVPPQIYHSVN